MMEFHYVVGYDSEDDKWFVESDWLSYFNHGSVYDGDRDDYIGAGWIVPKEGSAEEALDYTLLRILESCVPGILPTPATLEE
jgi:hypothetical protein